jgi:hypothetical protein
MNMPVTKIGWNFYEEPAHYDDPRKSNATAFSVELNWPYRSLSVHCYPTGADQPDDGIEVDMLHESIHVLLAPITEGRNVDADSFRHNVELTCDTLSAWVWAMYDKNKDLIKENEELRRKVPKRER